MEDSWTSTTAGDYMLLYLHCWDIASHAAEPFVQVYGSPHTA